MIKKKYIINITTNNTECLDSNLDLAVLDIRRMKQWKGDDFDFEISCLFDGFIINYNFNEILNTFLNDISKEGSLFYYIFESKDFVKYIKRFIANVRSSSDNINNWIENDTHLMEAFLYTKFYFRFILPETIITKEKYDNFRGLGPDYLIGTLHPEEIFEHLVPYLYSELASEGLLKHDELKDYGKYQIGLA
jgi:hypothetical protein